MFSMSFVLICIGILALALAYMAVVAAKDDAFNLELDKHNYLRWLLDKDGDKCED